MSGAGRRFSYKRAIHAGIEDVSVGDIFYRPLGKLREDQRQAEARAPSDTEMRLRARPCGSILEGDGLDFDEELEDDQVFALEESIQNIGATSGPAVSLSNYRIGKENKWGHPNLDLSRTEDKVFAVEEWIQNVEAATGSAVSQSNDRKKSKEKKWGQPILDLSRSVSIDDLLRSGHSSQSREQRKEYPLNPQNSPLRCMKRDKGGATSKQVKSAENKTVYRRSLHVTNVGAVTGSAVSQSNDRKRKENIWGHPILNLSRSVSIEDLLRSDASRQSREQRKEYRLNPRNSPLRCKERDEGGSTGKLVKSAENKSINRRSLHMMSKGDVLGQLEPHKRDNELNKLLEKTSNGGQAGEGTRIDRKGREPAALVLSQHQRHLSVSMTSLDQRPPRQYGRRGRERTQGGATSSRSKNKENACSNRLDTGAKKKIGAVLRRQSRPANPRPKSWHCTRQSESQSISRLIKGETPLDDVIVCTYESKVETTFPVIVSTHESSNTEYTSGPGRSSNDLKIMKVKEEEVANDADDEDDNNDDDDNSYPCFANLKKTVGKSMPDISSMGSVSGRESGSKPTRKCGILKIKPYLAKSMDCLDSIGDSETSTYRLSGGIYPFQHEKHIKSSNVLSETGYLRRETMTNLCDRDREVEKDVTDEYMKTSEKEKLVVYKDDVCKEQENSKNELFKTEKSFNTNQPLQASCKKIEPAQDASHSVAVKIGPAQEMKNAVTTISSEDAQKSEVTELASGALLKERREICNEERGKSVRMRNNEECDEENAKWHVVETVQEKGEANILDKNLHRLSVGNEEGNKCNQNPQYARINKETFHEEDEPRGDDAGDSPICEIQEHVQQLEKHDKITNGDTSEGTILNGHRFQFLMDHSDQLKRDDIEDNVDDDGNDDKDQELILHELDVGSNSSLNPQVNKKCDIFSFLYYFIERCLRLSFCNDKYLPQLNTACRVLARIWKLGDQIWPL